MKLQRIVLLAATFVLSSCASEQLEERIDQVFEMRKEVSYDEGPRLSWSVGQWALFRITRTSGETILRLFGGSTRGFRRYSVTRKEGSTFWLEIHEVFPDRERHYALQLGQVHPDRMRDLRLLQVKTLQNDGEVATFGEDENGPADVHELRERFRVFTGAMDLVDGTGRVRRVTVPAGTFEEAYVVPVSRSLEKGRQAGHAWFTNAVPIAYYAKYFQRVVSWIWGESTVHYELVDFGLEGAESRFFEEGT